jgi:hypothetical protein
MNPEIFQAKPIKRLAIRIDVVLIFTKNLILKKSIIRPTFSSAKSL